MKRYEIDHEAAALLAQLIARGHWPSISLSPRGFGFTVWSAPDREGGQQELGKTWSAPNLSAAIRTVAQKVLTPPRVARARKRNA